MRLRVYATGILLSVTSVIYLTNSSLLLAPPASGPTLLAHRGLAQTYDLTGVTAETCTASRMHPPTHDHLENTIASMSAAFDLGADVVEFDVHPTTDGHFAVFHESSLSALVTHADLGVLEPYACRPRSRRAEAARIPARA
jgi:glycerophosphoryl diester phosphodiesterase